MSVIVSDEDGQIILLCKGADKYVFYAENYPLISTPCFFSFLC